VAGRNGRVRRLFGAAAVVLAAAAALLTVVRAARDRSSLATGRARWIWYSREIPEPAPLRFRAWKEFSLASASPAAPVLLFGDRTWSLEINSVAVAHGEQRPGDRLFVGDAAKFLRPGTNRIAIDVASSDGVGGLLFHLELPKGREIASDGTWRVERIDPRSEGERSAVVWGRPPMYPWGYPDLPPKRE